MYLHDKKHSKEDKPGHFYIHDVKKKKLSYPKSKALMTIV